MPDQVTPTSPVLLANSLSEVPALQANLIEWAHRKVTEERQERDELAASCEHAKKRKWAFKAIQAATRRAARRVMFYEKALAALEAGYALFPSLDDCEVIAIRTDRKKPSYKVTTYSRDAQDASKSITRLRVGEGRYVSADTSVMSWDEEKQRERKGKIETVTVGYHYADKYQDVAWPLLAARPQIMQAADRAMTLKIFDEIGILPPRAKKDPVIVGSIVRREGYQTLRMSFLISWFVDVRHL